MQNGRHGGLSGKERVYRLRERAARERAEEWVSECLDVGEEVVPASRPVPVHRRAAFLASVSGGGGADMGESSQLQLALRSVSLVEVPAPANFAGKSSDAAGKAGMRPAASVSPVRAAGRSSDAAAKPPPTSTFKLNSRRNHGERFSLVGFAWGCALGGAAAAVLLLVAWAIVG